MSTLTTTTNLDDPDGFYAALLEAHEGLTEAESMAFNARLVFVLANHIGDAAVLAEALNAAAKAKGRRSGHKETQDSD